MAEAPKDLGPIPITTLAGSSFPNFKRVCSGRRVDKKFTTKYRLSKLVSWIMEVFRLWEEMRWGSRVKDYKMPEPPVFIIGHWRSGTTFLHNLMSKDPQFAYCTTFQATFPNILLCHQWWFKPILKVLMPKRRPSDGVLLGADFPQEEDFGLGNMIPNTIYNAFYFPSDFKEYLDQNINRSTESNEDDLKFRVGYKKFSAKALLNPIFKRRGARRLLSKNPPHTARIDQLLKIYPHARFIYLERDPYDTIASFKKFALGILPGLQFQGFDMDLYESALIGLYKEVRDKYDSTKMLIPDGQLIELKYDDLILSPLGTAGRIYSELNINGYEDVRHLLEEYISTQRSHKVAGYQHSPEYRQRVDANLGLGSI